MNDFRFAVRQLLKHPGFTAVAVLSLALGIGANATVLCWLHNVLWRPLAGVAQQEQIVGFVSNQGSGNVSLTDLRDLGDLQPVFAGAVASQITPASLTADNHTEWIYGQIATANFFELLGVKPILGRTFLADEDRRPGGDAVLVISESFWKRRFDGDRSVIGRVVNVNRHPFTIVGVVPAPFLGTMTGLACDFWTPISMIAEATSRHDNSLTSRNSRGFHNLGRLQPGVSLARAQAAVDGRDAQLAAAFPKTNQEVRHRVVPYSQVPYGAQSVLGPVLRLLLPMSLGVLLIVAGNVANLLLARATSRQREIAIRLAVGAGRGRLIRQLLTESVVLALLGGMGGVLLASWAADGVAWFLPTFQLPTAFDYQLDAMTLSLTLAITLSTGLVFGLVPALQASRPHLHESLKEGARAVEVAAHHRWRNALVVAEVAIALVLLIGAALCLKGMQRARQIDPGFDPRPVLTAGLQIGMNGYTEERGRAFYRRLRERLAETPGIEEAALA
ncbi:MAG: ABC transporter permease, partial [Limisphaerales bacterium]